MSMAWEKFYFSGVLYPDSDPDLGFFTLFNTAKQCFTSTCMLIPRL